MLEWSCAGELHTELYFQDNIDYDLTADMEAKLDMIFGPLLATQNQLSSLLQIASVQCRL